MSHIPNSAMPHAGNNETMEREQESGRGLRDSMRDRAGQVMESARAHPKTAAAAGAAVVAGIAAAAATPFMLRRKNESSKSSGKSRKSS